MEVMDLNDNVKFQELGLSETTLKSLEKINYFVPSDIQSKALPPALNGKDLIAQARTGSGKTAVFAITIVEQIDTGDINPQALVLSPTRELALQVTDEIERIGFHKKVKAVTIYGGQDIRIQLKKLKNHPQVIVATPGRLIDHLRRGTITLDTIRILVIDEADKMLEIGFLEDIELIIKQTHKNKQLMLFSATMPEEIMQLAKKYLKKPVRIKTSQDDLKAAHIEQTAYILSQEKKFNTLISILRSNRNKKILIFTNTKKYGRILFSKLRTRNYKVQYLSGDLTQKQRERALHWFREGNNLILIASDVASRGLDITDIDLVINYDFPKHPRLYVHRIGRTGRFSKRGKAISLVTHDEVKFLNEAKRKNTIKIITLDKYKPEHNIIK